MDDYRMFRTPVSSMPRELPLGVYPDLVHRAMVFLNYPGSLETVELSAQSLAFSQLYLHGL